MTEMGKYVYRLPPRRRENVEPRQYIEYSSTKKEEIVVRRKSIKKEFLNQITALLPGCNYKEKND